MADIQDILNGEDGLSVRNKLNELINRVNRVNIGIEVYKVTLDLANDFGSNVIIPLTEDRLFAPMGILAITTKFSGTVTNPIAFTFSQLTGWSKTSSLSLGSCNTLGELTYVLDESYSGRIAIDLRTNDWTISTDQVSGATEHEVQIIIWGKTV